VKGRCGRRWRGFEGRSTKRRSDYARRRLRPLFPPPAEETTGRGWVNKGIKGIDHLTSNGEIRIERRIYWKKGRGTDDQIDRWLGIADRTVSVEARELCSRVATAVQGFDAGVRVLDRLAQLTVSKERLRQITEREGQSVREATRLGVVRPEWTAADCRVRAGGPTRIMVGTDGVKVPMVTVAEKQTRRKKRGRKRRGQPRRKRMFKGYTEAYKEFKIGAFYDQAKDHQYVFGTAGNHEVLGRLLRREACRLNVGQADQKQSITDGATWIYRQLQIQLPILDVMTLDFFHLAEHVGQAGVACFGAETEAGRTWIAATLHVAKTEGAAGLFRQIDQTRRTVRAPTKRQALTALETYLVPRAAMVDYPTFIQRGLDIGSGPTEAFCKTLTMRLKGSGMKWDWPNAEAMMALAALDQSHLWDRYWELQRKLAA
jgi:hypothetical protein